MDRPSYRDARTHLKRGSKKEGKKGKRKREKEKGRKKNRIGLLVLLTTCLNLTKITKFQDHQKETRLIMPKKIVI